MPNELKWRWVCLDHEPCDLFWGWPDYQEETLYGQWTDDVERIQGKLLSHPFIIGTVVE